MEKTDYKTGNKITLILKTKDKKKYKFSFQDKFRQMSSDNINFNSFFMTKGRDTIHEIMRGDGRNDNGMGAIDFANEVIKKIGTNEILDSPQGIINMKDVKDYEIESEMVGCPVRHYHCSAD